MSYCKFCGAEVPEGEVCSCAEAQNAEVKKTSSVTKQSTAIQSTAIFCAVVVIFVIILANLFSGGYKKPVDKFFTGIEKCNVNTIAKSLPSESADEFKESVTDDNLETLVNLLEVAYGSNVKISYDIEDKERLDSDDIEELEDSSGLKIKKAYELTVNIKIKGKTDEEETTTDITVAKIKGEGWKILGDGNALSDIF